MMHIGVFLTVRVLLGMIALLLSPPMVAQDVRSLCMLSGNAAAPFAPLLSAQRLPCRDIRILRDSFMSPKMMVLGKGAMWSSSRSSQNAD